jgi:hypothetical protein
MSKSTWIILFLLWKTVDGLHTSREPRIGICHRLSEGKPIIFTCHVNCTDSSSDRNAGDMIGHEDHVFCCGNKLNQSCCSFGDFSQEHQHLIFWIVTLTAILFLEFTVFVIICVIVVKVGMEVKNMKTFRKKIDLKVRFLPSSIYQDSF